ncbi:MAG: hypothetical protein LBK53_07600 [Heliobacteriaceae bacterium]|jgi:hypothetical protein|nr:hypothetical protein [Heliobacteriaceae bacterium]
MASIASLLSQVFLPAKTTAVSVRSAGYNPFVNYNGNSLPGSYAKNKPVRGGYFAGYHNGKQNIVGRRLFIEV